MGKCEHGLTSKECYVCASPKHGGVPKRQESAAHRKVNRARHGAQEQR